MWRWLVKVPIAMAILAVLLGALVYVGTYHPDAVQPETVHCRPDTPVLQPGQSVRVMSWNVQFMAGGNKLFFYDMEDWSQGPDTRVSRSEVLDNMADIRALIEQENPDILLLQEVHTHNVMTGYIDQEAWLRETFAERFPCSAGSYYWKAAFVPLPPLMGPVDMKLMSFSKYRIDKATRYQLALKKNDPVSRQMDFKRAMLAVEMPVAGAGPLVAINTHLDAFAQGDNTMQRQVGQVASLLQSLNARGDAWLIGGDFNLLPPGAYDGLAPSQQYLYEPETALGVLLKQFQSLPDPQAMQAEPLRWYTHQPNDPDIQAPDRTIDYIFYSDRLALEDFRVLNQTALGLSDHFPLAGRWTLPVPSAAETQSADAP
jgi:endonuclease/exonuclease/phosphatase family metal-dependent hydrolase